MKPSSAQGLDGMKGQLQTSLMPEPSISGPESRDLNLLKNSHEPEALSTLSS